MKIESYLVKDLAFLSGETRDVRVAYAVINDDKPEKTCFIPTCYGGRIADTLNFSSGCLKEYRVVVAAMLGNGESSSPSNTQNFPKKLDYQDQIHAHYRLLTEHLKISQLEAVIGFSMGGQQAYYWATMYPEFAKRAVAICGSAKTASFNYAFLEGPISALINSWDYIEYNKKLNDPDYKGKLAQPEKGLRAFGRSYCPWALSSAWFREEKYKEAGHSTAEEFIAKDWETAFAGSWEAEDVLILARQWQAGDIGMASSSKDYKKALAAIPIPVLVMPSRTDLYFPPEDSEIEMQHLKHGELAIIDTIWGHVAGGGANKADTDFMDAKIAAFLQK